MAHQHRRHGFTLIELMISMAVMGVVLVQAYSIFVTQHRAHTGLQRTVEVQQSVRLVADAILSDLRMAGYMVPAQAGVASLDGGNNAADVLCISDPSRIADDKAQAAGVRFDLASITGAVDGGDSQLTVDADEVDIDSNLEDDFIAERGLILVDDDSSHCAFITGVGGGGDNNIISFTPATPAGFDASIANARVVPAVIYRLNGTDLIRNNLRVASQVEDLQIEFGLDADDNGLLAAGEFQHDLNGRDPLDLLAVRLTIVVRGERTDETVRSTGRPAVGNRAAGAADGIRRRTVTALITPRNIHGVGGS
ncbi:MAG: PilW family protein [Deltaproteobacteria bacterium]|nr:PilW family protein [Deltaproteobacteria bacterium]